MRGLIIGLALISAVEPALAVGCAAPPEAVGLSAADQARMERLEASRAKGLAGALTGEIATDRKVVQDLFLAPTRMPDAERLAGDYQCRTIKLGGITPLQVYGWFRCRISGEGDQLILEKLTGSQNFVGTLTPAGEGYIFKGAGHYGYEGPRAYGADPKRNEVGCLTAVGDEPGHLLLEEPEPEFESFHDVIELRPAS